MKILFDLVPISGFFIAYILSNIYTATIVLMILSPLFQIIGYRLYSGFYDKTLVITTLAIEVFGALTLIFHNPHFIQWKFTVVYWLIATALLVTPQLGYPTLLESALRGKIDLPTHILNRCNTAWALLFIAMGGLNILVIYTCTQQTWVYFKLFGATGLMVVSGLVFGIYIQRYLNLKNEIN